MKNFSSRKLGDHQAVLQIDLLPYLTSFANYQGDSTKEKEYEQNYNKLVEEVTGINGACQWDELFSLAAEAFTPEDVAIIKSSPAYAMLNNSFVEILKNTMDNSVTTRANSISLALKINYNPEKKQVEFVLTDTGQGFPHSFLSKMASKETQQAYTLDSGSEKNRSNANESVTEPKLFGGAGRGLRILIAEANFGAKLIRAGYLTPKYQLGAEDLSRVELSNNSEQGGAKISLTTSLAPFAPAIDSTYANSDIDSPRQVDFIDHSSDEVLTLPKKQKNIKKQLLTIKVDDEVVGPTIEENSSNTQTPK